MSLQKVYQNIENNFWKDVFKAWTKYKKINSEEIDVSKNEKQLNICFGTALMLQIY